MAFTFSYPYAPDPQFSKTVAYFCMEFAIDQALKTYAGGLGFLAGSHLRSAYSLRQPMIGIGILWKYGYYDQQRATDRRMSVAFVEKQYGFLQPTGIKFSIEVSGYRVMVTAYYLSPEVFGTAPLFLLSTDLPDNDFLARTICHKLYDANPEAKIAAAILLGRGGALLLEQLNITPDIYHLNESHGLPLAFYLLHRFGTPAAVGKKVVFTNHTPEAGGNPKTDLRLLSRMGFFPGMTLADIEQCAALSGGVLDSTLTAFRLAGKTNAVSRLHYGVLRDLQLHGENINKLCWITNAQQFDYWADKAMYGSLNNRDDAGLIALKQQAKLRLFAEVADQCGKIFSTNILTIVFAKRFGDYKRPGLLLRDMDRFRRIVTNTQHPVQLIWAGKPYPFDYEAVALFDYITSVCSQHHNCVTLTGYELKLSRLLKAGADIWLNTPRLTHEASGTSGMSAAMNGALNVSTADGWFPEFAIHNENCFMLPVVDSSLPPQQQDDEDARKLYDLLEQSIIPLYYDDAASWLNMVKQSMKDIIPRFDSDRMAREYYEKLYNLTG